MVIFSKIEKRYERMGWLLRYWLLDKYHDRLRMAAFGLSVIITCAFVIKMMLNTFLQSMQPLPKQHEAYYQIIVQIIIAIVMALISYALTPKPEDPKPGEAKSPVAEDGKSIERIYGTVWTDDGNFLGWKKLGTEAIKQSGGKK